MSPVGHMFLKLPNTDFLHLALKDLQLSARVAGEIGY